MTFYEEVDRTSLSDSQKADLSLCDDNTDDGKIVHATKSLCLLSRWPFFDTFKKYLLHVFQLTTSSQLEVPIERLVVFIWESCHKVEAV